MTSEVTLEFCKRSFRNIGLIAPATIACLGLIGTVLSLLVIPRMRYFIGRIESFLLICLSTVDLLILSTQVIRTLAIENSFEKFAATSEIPQRALRRVLMTFYFIETWIIVLIAFNRFVALCFPFYQGRLNTPTFMKFSVVAVVVIGISVNAVDFSTFNRPFSTRKPSWHKDLSNGGGGAGGGYNLVTDVQLLNSSSPTDVMTTTIIPVQGTTNKWGSSGGKWGSSGGQWGSSGNNGTASSIWQEKWYRDYVLVVDRLLLAFIPCLIILILDISMVAVLIKMRRTRSAMTMQKGVSGSNTAITILLSVAISYVIVNLPYHGFVIHVWYIDKEGDHCNFVKMALNLAMIVNCSINFFLYFMLSSTFRKILKQIFTTVATCYCRNLNISHDESDGPNKVPLIFLSKQNGSKPRKEDEVKATDESKAPIYRPVPKPRHKKSQSTSSGPTSELMLSNSEV